MFMDDRKRALVRTLIGGIIGVAAYLLLAFVAQPGALLGGSFELAFTFCFNSRVPQGLGAALGILLWFAFGAEIGLSTLPFAQDGPALVKRSLLHFLAMAATVSAWALLNFGLLELSFFLIPLALIYVLIWLGRWIGWYAEADAIRKKLGLAPAPSPLKWRETLPYLPFAALLCLALPALLGLWDAPDVPVLRGLLFPWLLLPVGCLFSALSLGRRKGVCPLYPAACALLTLAAVCLVYNSTAWPYCIVALAFSLAGSLIGAALRNVRN